MLRWHGGWVAGYWRAGVLVASAAVGACGASSSTETSGSGASSGSGGSGGSSGSGGSTHAGGGTAGSGSVAGGGFTYQFGTGREEEAFDIGVDAKDDVFVLSRTDDVAAMVLHKLDRAGKTLFTQELPDPARALAVHPGGDAIVVGSIAAPDAKNAEASDALVRRYGPNGTVRWTRQLGAEGSDIALDVNVDQDGHVFVLWSSSVQVDGTARALSELDAAGNELTRVGLKGSFLVQTIDRRGNVLTVDVSGGYALRLFDSLANELWTAPMEGVPTGLFVDGDGNVLVAALGETHPSTLTKLDPNGAQLFFEEFGGPSEFAGLVAADPTGNVFVVGTAMAGSSVEYDTRVWRFDAGGNGMGEWMLGTTDYDVAWAIAVDGTGALLVAGSTRGAFPGLAASGDKDGFVVRLEP